MSGNVAFRAFDFIARKVRSDSTVAGSRLEEAEGSAIGDAGLAPLTNAMLTALQANGMTLLARPNDGSAFLPICSVPAGVSEAISPEHLSHFPREAATWVSASSLAIAWRSIGGTQQMCALLSFRDLDDDGRQVAQEIAESQRSLWGAFLHHWWLSTAQARQIHALENSLHALDFGVVLIRGDGAIQFANMAAETLLATGDGLRRHRSRLQATNLADGVRLQVAINHVLATGGDPAAPARQAPIVRLRRVGGKPLILVVVPVEQDGGGDDLTAALTYIFDPQLDTERLLLPVCSMFGLSPSERRLATLIAGGATVTEAAEAMHIRLPTARSYLKQIFIKTDTSRQAELTSLLLSSGVRLDRRIIADHSAMV